jgi:DNA-binding NarL/FixJ family response regulator
MMAKKKKIVVAEDQRIVRKGLCSLLTPSDEFEIVGEAEDGLEAVRAVQACKPDLVLLDLSMPRLDGIAAIQEIKKEHPETKILALTVHDSDEHILAAFQAGADGYCLKDATHAELLTSIRSVLSGKVYLSPAVSKKVVEGYVEGKRSLKTASSWDRLSQREREVLKLVGEGYKTKEIADYLCISWKTVQKHRANIMDKLGVHSASALTAYAIEKGLVPK